MDSSACLSRRRLLGFALACFALWPGSQALAAPILPRKRPEDFRFSYRFHVGGLLGDRSRSLVITPTEAWCTRGRMNVAKPQAFVLSAAERDAFYAALRATGLARAESSKRMRVMRDYPSTTMIIEWGDNRIAVSYSDGTIPSDLAAWDRALALVRRLMAQKGGGKN